MLLELSRAESPSFRARGKGAQLRVTVRPQDGKRITKASTLEPPEAGKSRKRTRATAGFAQGATHGSPLNCPLL